MKLKGKLDFRENMYHPCEGEGTLVHLFSLHSPLPEFEKGFIVETRKIPRKAQNDIID